MRRAALCWIMISGIVILSAGCGTSGSRPQQFAEARFQVRPAGRSVFTAELSANGVRHTFGGTEFTATSLFDFVLENAGGPYSGTFTLKDGGDIQVILSFGDQTITGQTWGIDTQAKVSNGDPAAPAPGSSAEVRFDVCVPSASATSCFQPGDSGIFGLPFNGTIGDANTTHLIFGSTPTIYLLEGAEDSVSGVFTLTPFTGQSLLAQLFINGELKDADSDTHDVLLKENL